MSVSKLLSPSGSVFIVQPSEFVSGSPVSDRIRFFSSRRRHTRLAASNAEIGAKLITLKPVGKRSPSRRIVASQSANEVASGGCQEMGAIAPTFKLTEEPYSNPGVAAGHICLHSGRHRMA